jgi:DNA-binding protein HU-beta
LDRLSGGWPELNEGVCAGLGIVTQATVIEGRPDIVITGPGDRVIVEVKVEEEVDADQLRRYREHLAEKVGVPRKTAAEVLLELVTLVTKEAKSSGQFVVPGLGEAVKANRKARTGRNPQTGEAIKIPAKTVAKFLLAKAFKDAVVPPKKK